MKIDRELKNITFAYNLLTREFTLIKGEEIILTKGEAGAFQRFIFSMFQFHPNKKK